MSQQIRAAELIARRDGMSIEDAQKLVDDTIEECIFVADDELWMENTGLEPDYLIEELTKCGGTNDRDRKSAA